ncbi:MAG: hypothetical protein RIQ52_906 [Pseudomonadota bacterium]
MSDLIVIAFNDVHKAEEVRLSLLRMQRDYLIDLEDAVVAVRKPDGSVKLNQAVNLTSTGAASGGFWGLLVGTLFLNPLLGVAVGALSGAAAGALSDLGINDQFMKEVGESLKADHSALFVLVRKMTSDKVLEELHGAGGKIIRTSLSHDDEVRLQSALDAKD